MSSTPSQNPFNRYAYNPYHTLDLLDSDIQEVITNKQPFTGGDLQAYINNRRVDNLEQITWSISVEMMGNYVMGRRDAVTYTTGKRVVVGNAVFSQWDRHAFLEEIWRLNSGKNSLNIRTIGDLWSFDSNNVGEISRRASTTSLTDLSTNGSVRTGYLNERNTDYDGRFGTTDNLRGLSPQDFDRQLREQLQQTARIVGAIKFRYSDQIPPFDLTLVGVNTAGAAARCAIMGMRITQETTGFSQNDLNNAVACGFVALAVDPWLPVESDSGTAYVPPVA